MVSSFVSVIGYWFARDVEWSFYYGVVFLVLSVIFASMVAIVLYGIVWRAWRARQLSRWQGRLLRQSYGTQDERVNRVKSGIGKT